MKLVKFSVTNFRSISKAFDIPLTGTTVLVGKNNEGKSNFLRALSIAMKLIQDHAYEQKFRGAIVRHASSRRYAQDTYAWQRDYPIVLQNRARSADTSFKLEFEFDSDEIKEFRTDVGSNLNGSLPLNISVGKTNRASISVPKGGRGNATLNANSGKITDFIAKRITFNYIPAVRTHNESMFAIDGMVSKELEKLENNEEYQKALNKISDLQKPVLDDLAQRIKEPLSEFLPNITGVKINISEDDRRTRLRRDFEVIIDDGTPTSLETKGDGVKSLATLGMLKNRVKSSGISVIAIEEPESHLHPEAIHQLKEIISTLEITNQVVLTTHNPLFVNRSDVSSNIIVDGGKAVKAKSIKEIRETLGVRVSDNLSNASYVLLVEGDDDKITLQALMPLMSTKIQKCLRENILLIDTLEGAGSLPYKLTLHQNHMCQCHTLLDNDPAGHTAYDKALKANLIGLQNITFVNCKGMPESELEDCLLLDSYKQAVEQHFVVRLSVGEFRTNKKWSDRMKSVFQSQGKPWSDSIKAQVKQCVANAIAMNPINALNPHKRDAIDGLIHSLEVLVAKVS